MDVYKLVTDRFISELENGVVPWRKPWIGTGVAVRHVGGAPYSLLNQLLLGKPGEYVTYNQCKKEGGNVRKGAKAKIVVFWKMLERQKKNKDGTPKVKKDGSPDMESIPFLQYSNVFHLDDCEGIEPRYAKESARPEFDPIEEAEKIVQNYVQSSGVGFHLLNQNQAYYQPSTDVVVLPTREQFNNAESFYATAFHELTHSTGHPTRLNRLDRRAAFGSDVYSKEELVAEIGSAYLMSTAGIETDERFRNSASYVQSWLNALRNDRTLIVSAAGKAEKAVDYILKNIVTKN